MELCSPFDTDSGLRMSLPLAIGMLANTAPAKAADTLRGQGMSSLSLCLLRLLCEQAQASLLGDVEPHGENSAATDNSQSTARDAMEAI